MPRSVAIRLVAFVVMLAILALPAQRVGATQTEFVNGTFTFPQGGYEYFTHVRNVS